MFTMNYLLRILCVFLLASGSLCTPRRYARPDPDEVLHNDVLDRDILNSEYSLPMRESMNGDNLNTKKVTFVADTPEMDQPEFRADGEGNANSMADQMEGSDGLLLDDLEGRDQFDGGKGNANLSTYKDADIIREAVKRLARLRSGSVADRKKRCGKYCDKDKFRGPTGSKSAAKTLSEIRVAQKKHCGKDYDRVKSRGPTRDKSAAKNLSGRRVAQKKHCRKDYDRVKSRGPTRDNSAANIRSGRRLAQKQICGKNCYKAKFRGPTGYKSAANNQDRRRVAPNKRCGKDYDRDKLHGPRGDISTVNNRRPTILDQSPDNLMQARFDARQMTANPASNQLRQNRRRLFYGQMKGGEGTSLQNVRPNYYSAGGHGLEINARKRNGFTKIFKGEQKAPSEQFWGLPNEMPWIGNDLSLRQYENDGNHWSQYMNMPPLHSFGKADDDVSKLSEYEIGLRSLQPTLKPEDIKQYENVLKYRPFTKFDTFLKERNKFYTAIAQKRSQKPALNQDRRIASNMKIIACDNTRQNQGPKLNSEPDFWQYQEGHMVPVSRYQILNQAPISPYQPPNQLPFSSNQPSNTVPVSSNQPSNRALISQYQPSVQVLPFQPSNTIPVSSNQPSNRELFSQYQQSVQDPGFTYQPPNHVPFSSNQPSNIAPMSSNQPTNQAELPVQFNQPSCQALAPGEKITASQSTEPCKKEVLCKEWTITLVQDPNGAPTLRLVHPNKKSSNATHQDRENTAQKRDPNQNSRSQEQWTIALREEPNNVPTLELRPRQRSEQTQPDPGKGSEEQYELTQASVATADNINSVLQKQWIIALKHEPNKPPLLAIKPVSREERTHCNEPPESSKAVQRDPTQQDQASARGESRTLQIKAPRQDSTQSQPVRIVAALQQATRSQSKPAVKQICEWHKDGHQSDTKQKPTHGTKAVRRQKKKKKVLLQRMQKHVNRSLAVARGKHDQRVTYKKRNIDARTRFKPQNKRQKQWG